MSHPGKLDVHGCVACVREHFYKADYLQLTYTLPVEAYSLNRTLQYNICTTWDRFRQTGSSLIERECILLAEAWFISAIDHTKPMYVNESWTPDCVLCGRTRTWHKLEHISKEEPNRWTCEDGKLYEPVEYKLPQLGKHPSDIEVNR